MSKKYIFILSELVDLISHFQQSNKKIKKLTHVTLQFSKSNERSCEGDSTNECSQEKEGLDHVAGWVSSKVRLLQQIV